MCAACAMTAAGAVAGTRTWLQTRGWTWLTPARLPRATIGACVVALVVPSVGLTGSSASPAHAPTTAAAAR